MKIIKSLLGKHLFKIKKLFFRKTHLEYSGPYESWGIANQNSVGYDSSVILEKIKKSTFEVLDNEQIYERDGRSFSEKPLPSSKTIKETLSSLVLEISTIIF